MNRGSLDSAGADRYPRHAFNEAPIHESGKCADRARISVPAGLLQ